MSSRIAVAVLVVPALAAGLGASAARPNQTEQAFVQGGQIFMDLSAGQYVIRGTEEPKIRLECTTREAADLERVRVNVGVNGKAGSFLSRRHTSSPSIFGIMTSSKIRSGCSAVATASASSPSAAVRVG